MSVTCAGDCEGHPAVRGRLVSRETFLRELVTPHLYTGMSWSEGKASRPRGSYCREIY